MSVVIMGFKERLKELRTKKGITQEVLASYLDIPESTIRRYESSEDSTPRRERLEKIADFFDVSVDFLLGRQMGAREALRMFEAHPELDLQRTDDPFSSDNKDKATELTEQELRILEEMKKYPVFFNDLASDPSKIKKVIKMWEFIKTDIENDDEEEPED